MRRATICIIILLSLQSTALAPVEAVVVEVVEEGPEGEWVLMNISAYTAGYESCGKLPDDPSYGITASGNRAREWHTVAAGRSIPFGKKIYIPEFENINGGWFTVEDRGGAIGDGNIDVYMEKLEDAIGFGRKDIYIFIPYDE